MQEIHESLRKPVSTWTALQGVIAHLGELPSDSYLRKNHPELWTAVQHHGGLNHLVKENSEDARIGTTIARERHNLSIHHWEKAVQGDGQAQEKLLDFYRPTAKKIATRLYSRKLRGTWKDWMSVDSDDLIQEGLLALYRKLPDYDPSKSKFQYFAYLVMDGAMRHYLRDNALIIHEPGWIQELRSKLIGTYNEFLQEHQKKPTFEELAKKSGITVEEVIEGMTHYQPIPFNEQKIALAADQFEPIALKIILYRALREHVNLSRNEAVALSMSAAGHSPEEIASRLGVSYASAGSFVYQAKRKVRNSLLFKRELGLS